MTLPEQPHRIGLPSIFDPHWDPIIQACADTGTVICLHVASCGIVDMPQGAPAIQLGATLFGQLALGACAEWLWSGIPVRHPDVQIAMSEGGIGWVAMLIDRLDNMRRALGLRPGLRGRRRPPAQRRPAPQLHLLHDRRPVARSAPGT